MSLLSRYFRSGALTSKRWILRYTATSSPDGSKNVEVLKSRRAPGSPSKMDPPSTHTPSSRASPPRNSVVGPGMGSAFSLYTFSRPWQLHSSGRATSSAPVATASRMSLSAAVRFSAFSGVEDIWIAAAINLRPFISLPFSSFQLITYYAQQLTLLALPGVLQFPPVWHQRGARLCLRPRWRGGRPPRKFPRRVGLG